MSTGQVVFSLDFELGWGHEQTRPSYVDELREHEDLVWERIASLVSLFEHYNVPATWAVVGKMVESGDDPLFHAPDLFETLVSSSPDHDIGLHSYGHDFYDQLSLQDARNDLTAGIHALKEWGYKPDSFVFPQNRVAHVDLLDEHEFHCYRSHSGSNTYNLTRLFSPETHEFCEMDLSPVPVPSSMFLAANRPSWYRRWYARRGIKKAATAGNLVHYWLHPHNVVTDDSLLGELESLLSFARSLSDAGNLSIQTMKSTSIRGSQLSSLGGYNEC